MNCAIVFLTRSTLEGYFQVLGFRMELIVSRATNINLGKCCFCPRGKCTFTLGSTRGFHDLKFEGRERRLCAKEGLVMRCGKKDRHDEC